MWVPTSFNRNVLTESFGQVCSSKLVLALVGWGLALAVRLGLGRSSAVGLGRRLDSASPPGQGDRE